MKVFLNEPAESYGEATTASRIGSIFSPSRNSSIYLSQPQYFPDKVAEMIRKLQRLKSLPPGWDSYSADAPSPVAVALAESFLVENYYLANLFYFLAPGVKGEIMIEFKKGDKAAELYFLPDGANELILYDKDAAVMEGNLNDHFKNLIAFFNS
ncbi:MAG: hypothetical protein EA411_02560 [Saprospirales bacterium]|nr:MAG: hypothetical protein EA411_02560 [Saprospirales bacterium]